MRVQEDEDVELRRKFFWGKKDEQQNQVGYDVHTIITRLGSSGRSIRSSGLSLATNGQPSLPETVAKDQTNKQTHKNLIVGAGTIAQELEV